MTQFKVTVRATSVLVEPGDEAMDRLEKLLDLLTYEDEFAEETKTLGYLYDEQMNILYLHKGVDLEYLRGCLGDCRFISFPSHRYEEMNFEYDEIVAPRDDDQADVIDFICGQGNYSSNLEDSQIFLVKQPGFGKCQPHDTIIPTPSGFRRFGDLEVGDKVFTFDGEPTEVTEIYEQGEQDVYEITFGNMTSMKCTKEHLIPIIGVMDNNNKTTWQYLRPSQLTLEEIMEHLHKDVNNYFVPLFQHYVEFDNDYVIGDRLISRAGKQFIKCKLRCPIEYVYAPKGERFRFLRSIMMAAGTRIENNNRVYGILPVFHIIENTNIDHLVLMFRSLGYAVTDDVNSSMRTIVVHSRPFNINALFDDSLCDNFGECDYSCDICDDYRSCDYSCDVCYIGHRHNYSIHSLFPQHQSYGWTHIESIKKCDKKENCRCIKVKDVSSLYLTNDFIITHNTYCSGVGISKYKLKTLIIMHRDNLRKQWLKSLFNMSGYSEKEVYELSSSQELYDIAIGQTKLDYDVYLMTHATFRAAANRIQSMELLGKITDNLGIGMKIIDEAHLEFKDTLLMDAVMNVKRNLYLTATNGRSSQDENAIFKHVFKNATFYKQSKLLNDDTRPKKWVNYTTVAINTHCKPAIYQYRVAGGKGMNSASYGKWVIAYDKKKTHFQVCAELIKDLYNEDSHAKVLVFMPLIELCEECQEFLYKKLNYDDTFDYDLNIRTINSKNSKSENEYNKKADVIITTIASAGTGTDIPGITDIICCSPFVSGITATQVFGRIRYIPKTCHYYDIYDVSVPMDKIWIKSRSKKIRPLALNTTHVNWIPPEENSENT